MKLNFNLELWKKIFFYGLAFCVSIVLIIVGVKKYNKKHNKKDTSSSGDSPNPSDSPSPGDNGDTPTTNFDCSTCKLVQDREGNILYNHVCNALKTHCIEFDCRQCKYRKDMKCSDFKDSCVIDCVKCRSRGEFWRCDEAATKCFFDCEACKKTKGKNNKYRVCNYNNTKCIDRYDQVPNCKIDKEKKLGVKFNGVFTPEEASSCPWGYYLGKLKDSDGEYKYACFRAHNSDITLCPKTSNNNKNDITKYNVCLPNTFTKKELQPPKKCKMINNNQEIMDECRNCLKRENMFAINWTFASGLWKIVQDCDARVRGECSNVGKVIKIDACSGQIHFEVDPKTFRINKKYSKDLTFWNEWDKIVDINGRTNNGQSQVKYKVNYASSNGWHFQLINGKIYKYKNKNNDYAKQRMSMCNNEGDNPGIKIKCTTDGKNGDNFFCKPKCNHKMKNVEYPNQKLIPNKWLFYEVYEKIIQ